jgi:transcriptional regulator with XRE-family HTH domain
VPKRRKSATTKDEKLIGQRLKQLRQRCGYTQVEVAEKLGIRQGLVSAYERGELRLHGVLLATFAKVLRASPNEVLGFERPKDEGGILQDHRFLRRLQKVDRLSKRDKQSLLGTIDAFLSKVP